MDNIENFILPTGDMTLNTIYNSSIINTDELKFLGQTGRNVVMLGNLKTKSEVSNNNGHKLIN